MTTGNHYPGLDPKSQARQEFVTSFAGTVEEAPYLEALAELLPASYVKIPPERLATITAPTLIVWGDDDPVVPIKAMRTFERAIPYDQSYVVHLGGHTPMMNSPDEFNCAVDAFLDGRELSGCKQYALTIEKRRDRLAGRDWGPRYE
jgi:pimeloyl-ACP methyl ester carboxylesterase